MAMKGLGELLDRLIEDQRAGPVHVCLLLAIWQSGERENRDGFFVIRRRELMRLAKIRGKTTYFRVIGDLAEWSYVEYWPSMAKEGKSRVRIACCLSEP